MSTRTDGYAHFPPDGRLIGLGLALVAILFLTISPLALLAFGFNYDESGGGVLEKIHPGTIVALGLLAIASLSQRNPLSALASAAASYPGTALFVVLIALMIIYSMQVVGLPFTSFFDTFLAPVVVFFLFKDMREGRAIRFVWLIHTLLISNALVGLFEFGTGVRITPLVASGLVIEDDWRSTALLGHPLANASLTGAYLLALALGAARDLPRVLAVGGFVISSAGMVVFGGRASTVILLVMLAALAAARSYDVFKGHPFNTRAILAALLAVPVVAIAVMGLEEAGFFDQFIERFFDDRGSADTRIEMFELFKHLSWFELLLAPDAAQLTTLKRIYGLDFGIESFWVSFVLNYGLIPGLVFFAGLFMFCRDIVRSVRPGGGWVLAFFFIVASTSVSLSAKTPLFAVLILLLLVLLRRSASDTQAAATAALRHQRRQRPRASGLRGRSSISQA